jgi:hypothetical protein
MVADWGPLFDCSKLVWNDGHLQQEGKWTYRKSTQLQACGVVFLRPGLQDTKLKDIIDNYTAGVHYFLDEASALARVRANWDSGVWKVAVDDEEGNQVNACSGVWNSFSTAREQIIPGCARARRQHSAALACAARCLPSPIAPAMPKRLLCATHPHCFLPNTAAERRPLSTFRHPALTATRLEAACCGRVAAPPPPTPPPTPGRWRASMRRAVDGKCTTVAACSACHDAA